MNPDIHSFATLGALSRPVDKRDYTAQATPATENAVHLSREAFLAPIYYQAKTPACSAHAAAWLAVYLRALRGDKLSFTPRFTWVNIKQTDADTNPNDGAHMRTAFQSLAKIGADPFEPLENNTALSNADYASPSVITQAMRDAAAAYKIGNYYFDDTATLEQICGHIDTYGAVMLLLQVGESMWTTKTGAMSWQEKDILPLRPPRPIVDGHFVIAHSYIDLTDAQYASLQGGIISFGHILQEYDPALAKDLGINLPVTDVQRTLLSAREPANVRILIFANSWSARWGFQGHGYFGREYMPYVLEVGMAELPPEPAPSTPVVTESTPTPTPIATTTQSEQTSVTISLTFLDRLAALINSFLSLFRKG